MNKYPSIEETIEKEAMDWYNRFHEPPTYAFVMPRTFEALKFEAEINERYGYRSTAQTGFRVLSFISPVGQLKILADATIDQPHIAYVSNDPESKYIDYIAEKILLGEENG